MESRWSYDVPIPTYTRCDIELLQFIARTFSTYPNQISPDSWVSFFFNIKASVLRPRIPTRQKISVEIHPAAMPQSTHRPRQLFSCSSPFLTPEIGNIGIIGCSSITSSWYDCIQLTVYNKLVPMCETPSINGMKKDVWLARSLGPDRVHCFRYVHCN